MTTPLWLAALLATTLGCGGESSTPNAPTADDVTTADTSEADVEALDATPTDAGEDAADTDDDVAVTYKAEWTQSPLGLGEDFVLKGVWGTSPDQLVAVGNKATVIERVDGQWKLVHQNTALDTLNAVWGSAPDDVWAVGAYGALLHRGKDGWKIGTGCSGDAACDDGDECTIDACTVDGECTYTGSGAAGCCGSVAFSENWDDGSLSRWTVADTSATGQGIVWHNAAIVDKKSGQKRATSGSNALYFGNPNHPCADDPTSVCPNFEGTDIVAATARSTAIVLPSASSVTAHFSVFIDTESSANWDILELIVTPYGLSTGTTVWTKEDVGGTTEGTFVDTSADLSTFAGQTVTLTWRFDSADSGLNDTEGVYIDSLTIDSTCGGELGQRFPTLFGVFGFAADNVYAVGNAGTVIHFDGQSWKQQVGGAGANLYAVAGTADAFLAGGSDGQVLSSFGGGGVSSERAIHETIRGFAPLADGRVVAIGDGGAGAVFSSGTWTEVPTGTAVDLHAIWAEGASAVAVGGSGTILRFAGAGFTTDTPLVTKTLYGVWGSGSDVWAVGEKATLLHDGGAGWEDQTLTGLGTGGNSELRVITGFSDSPLMIAVGGLGTIAERVDGTWNKVTSPITYTLHGMWGADSTDVWAVGNAGTLIRRQGGVWTKLEAPTKSSIYAVWGRSTSDVYAVGADNTLLHFDGTAWTLLRASTDAELRAVWGPSPTDVFAVGTEATIMHFDGLFWSPVTVTPDMVEGEEQAITAPLFDISGTGADTVFAAGQDGTILKLVRDGGLRFERLGVEPVPTLRGVTFSPEGVAFFVGREGTVESYDPMVGMVPEDAGTTATLYDAVAFQGGVVVSVGERGTVIQRRLVVVPPAP